jgi:ribosomal protein S18 acetylase RimI-like enzyme
MSQHLTVIRADLEHLELVAPLFDAYRQFYQQPPDLAKARQYLLDRLTRNESVIFLAVEGQAGLGFTQLYPSFSSLALKRLWILYDLFVAPTARRRGIAKALLERARQFAVETGATGLMLETAVNNLSAQSLYEQLGWQRDPGFYVYYLHLESASA